jgi:2-polyprenyl-3-methyl-5-hydroxy-6-metoxy-1,4-benzoquinol methylase
MTTSSDEFTAQLERKDRFEFGENWRRFLDDLTEERIGSAIAVLQQMLGLSDLRGKSLLDVGSGSGLMSLAARRLGARVTSLDYDPQSVACTESLRARFFPEDANWSVTRESVLDAEAMNRLGKFNVVYAWGVLHHTGNMWAAIENAAACVDAGGLFYLAIYNDQGATSNAWRRVKRAYNAAPAALRWAILLPALIRLWGPTVARDTLFRGRPLASWRGYGGYRGMSAWWDVVDWVGGLPFEVARPEAIFEFLSARAFQLQKLKTCGGGHGCNEYVFRRDTN